MHVGIVGLGAMGHALARALHAASGPARLVAVSSRRPDAARVLGAELPGVAPVSAAALAAHVDLVLLCVSDADITTAASDPAWTRGLTVAHTSGAQDLSVLQPAADRGARLGSFHPMVSVTRCADAHADDAHAADAYAANRFRGAVAAIDGDEVAQQQLAALAESLGLTPLHVPNAWRSRWHAAAAVVGNTSAALVAHAEHMLRDLPGGVAARRQALAGLLASVAQSLQQLPADQSATDAISGPIARGDTATVQRHLAALAMRSPNAAMIDARGGAESADTSADDAHIGSASDLVSVAAYEHAASLIALAMGDRLSEQTRRTLAALLSPPNLS